MSGEIGTEMPLSRSDAIEAFTGKLEELASGRTLVVPTYDYSFTSSGVFDMRTRRTDLGALSNEILRRENWFREATPVFSHAALEGHIPASTNPFSTNSIFHTLANTDSQIYLLGVDVSKMTFIHYVEDRAGIPYRYQKTFNGILISDEGLRETSVSFHVRPLSGIVSYDFEKISDLLIRRKVMHQLRSRSYVLRAREVMETLTEAMDKDALWALTPSSRQMVEIELSKLGRPFDLHDFE